MPPERVSNAVRRVVAARANELCEYCRSPAAFATQSFTVEHIQPRDAGGPATLDNLAWSCFGCNADKHAKTAASDPETGELVTLFNPRVQNWVDHFAWSPDAVLVVGITPIGRATVNALKLNRTGVMNLRRVLGAVGLHPPSQPG